MAGPNWRLAMAAGLLLAGCGAAGGPGDRFAPGSWEIKAWMESAGDGSPAGIQQDIVKLSAEDAARPPAAVFFTNFYHGVKGGDVRFEGGKVDGYFDQDQVDDIAGHRVPVSGTYARDRFRVTFDFKVFGITARHVVEGKLTGPA